MSTNIKDIENKIENIDTKPDTEQTTSCNLEFKDIKKVVKDTARNLGYRISWDYPKILRILDKTQSIKVAEFRPDKVTFYNQHYVFKQRLIERLKKMDKFSKEVRKEVQDYIKGK